MRDGDHDALDVAVRAYAVPTDPSRKIRKPGKGKRSTDRRKRRTRLPQRSLVFDTETTSDASQRLNFGCWRYYVDRTDGLPGSCCVEEGLFYADDLSQRNPDGFALLQAYVNTHKADVFLGRNDALRLLSRTDFVENVLYRYAVKQRATIVGFNLPFDLTRLAMAVASARRRFLGGNSLRLWEQERYRPRIAYKAIDSKRTLFGFTAYDGGDEQFRGHFLDLRTLSFALTDTSHSLESACQAFDVPYLKRNVEHGGIYDDYVTYCREDVGATANLLRTTIAEYRRHPIDLQPTKAFSPASIGKAYLKGMGVVPILDRQPGFPPEVLGWGMAAYFGGRAECRIRKTPLPVVYVDFLSMYSTVNALMGNWNLVVAQKILTDDATTKVQRLLALPDLAEQCFRPSFWPNLSCLVEVEPDSNVLPVRAVYDPAGVDYGIGVNPYLLNGTTWYSLADVVASVLFSGRPLKVRRAVVLRGVGRQGGLKRISVRGMVDIDPREGDFFRRVIELRRQVEEDPSNTEVERKRLSKFLKVLASATSYGVLAEFQRHEVNDPVDVLVYADGDPFTTKTVTPEDPGPYCFPPLAAMITGGARLMLALLEREVVLAGGDYMFCDTDSMGIVAESETRLHQCDGGGRALRGRTAVRSLSWDQVDRIVAKFCALSPYDRTVIPGSILKVEKENFDDDGCQRQLWCYAISAKRYSLFIKK